MSELPSVAPAAGSGLSRVATSGVDISHKAILYLDDITVSFDGFKALEQAHPHGGCGELRCAIGPNGAGKTTMMDVITGKTRPDAGTAFFGQTIDLTRLSEAQIADAGIGRKFQKPTVFENITVFENLELAMKADKRVRATLRAKLGAEQADRIAHTLAMIQLQTDAGKLAGLLSHGQKQWLEIGMLLMQEPKLLLLDEPVAGMTPRRSNARPSCSGRWPGTFGHGGRARHGVYRSIADLVTVLHEGRVLAEGRSTSSRATIGVIEVYSDARC